MRTALCFLGLSCALAAGCAALLDFDGFSAHRDSGSAGGPDAVASGDEAVDDANGELVHEANGDPVHDADGDRGHDAPDIARDGSAVDMAHDAAASFDVQSEGEASAADTSVPSLAGDCDGGPQRAADACGPSAPRDPCIGVAVMDDGLFCGLSTQFGFNAATAGPAILYHCVGGSTVQRTNCPNGCRVAPPGQPDRCNPDPCAGVSAAANGLYCGTSTQSGFNASVSDPSALYMCVAGVTAGRTTCAAGCSVAPAGQADHCN